MKEVLKVKDKYGFIYEVIINHVPHLGFSTAYYNDSIIADREFQKIHEPQSDDDSEWDAYNERFTEWRDEVNSDLIRSCEYHFNALTPTPQTGGGNR